MLRTCMGNRHDGVGDGATEAKVPDKHASRSHPHDSTSSLPPQGLHIMRACCASESHMITILSSVTVARQYAQQSMVCIGGGGVDARLTAGNTLVRLCACHPITHVPVPIRNARNLAAVRSQKTPSGCAQQYTSP